jgi:RHS repeat-associated protein
VTLYGLDVAGRRTSETNANLEVTQYGYNPADEITSLIDGLQHQRTWQYNPYGWVTNKTDGLNRPAFRYQYNPNGWLTNRWTPEKGGTAYTLDNVGNVTNVFYVGQASSLSFGYNLLNDLVTMQDLTGLTRFTRDAAGRVTAESNAWTAVSRSYTNGLRTLLTIQQSGTNWTQTYSYDLGWRMTNTTTMAGGFLYQFLDARPNLTAAILLPNGASITNGYDSLARLQSTALQDHWRHTLDGYTYGMDAFGLKTNILRDLGLTTNSVNVGYDNINQILSWNAKEGDGTPRLNEQIGYAYEAANNLRTRVNGGLTQIFTADAADQLSSVTRSGTFTLSGATPAPALSVTVNGQAAARYADMTFAATNLTLTNGANTFMVIATNLYGVKKTNIISANLPVNAGFTYDNNGNLTNDGAKALFYDTENQLTNVTVINNFKKDFVYDGLNRLRIKREYTWTNSAWTKTNEIRFIWDGNVIVQLRDLNNVPTLTLTRGLDLSGSLQGAGGIGGILAMTEGNGVTSYFHQDGLGNVTALMDGREQIVGRRMFDAFGKTLRLTGSKAGINPFWNASQLHDEMLDIDFYRYRPKPSGLPIWLTQDPAGLRGGVNPYGFNLNNPLRFIDPTGKAPRLNTISYNPATGETSVGYQDGHFGDGYGKPNDWSDPFDRMYRDYNSALDAVTPPIDPNTDPYAYAAAQTARDMAFAAALAALADRLAPPEMGAARVSVKPCPPKPLGRGNTGRNTPNNLKEKLSMEEAMSDPLGNGREATSTPMGDPRWLASDGWVKMRNADNSVHWVQNSKTGEVDDFKFKD